MGMGLGKILCSPGKMHKVDAGKYKYLCQHVDSV